MRLEEKLNHLKEILNEYPRITVALSGGVDSIFLTVFAHKLWGDSRVSAITALGPHFAPDEAAYAETLCRKLGIAHQTFRMDSVLPIIADNPPDRCYHCKYEIFSALKKQAEQSGSIIADGTNLDDMQDYRPGIRALEELDVKSPLKEAGLTKEEIRQALREMASRNPVLADALIIQPEEALQPEETMPQAEQIVSRPAPMPIWEKPAFACLASRIPYGDRITEEKLHAVYQAERFLRGIGFTQVRVRAHGDVARIEVLPEARARFFNEIFMEQVSEAIKSCGFKYVTLDLNGYKMGNLNQ